MTEDRADQALIDGRFLDQLRESVRDRDVRLRPRMSILKNLEEMGPDGARAELRGRLETTFRRLRKNLDQLNRAVR